MNDLPTWLDLFQLPMPATLGSVNVYLITGPGGVALIDTGLDDALSRKELGKHLAGRGLALSDVDKVVFTHHHVDHAGLGKTIAEAGAETLMSRVDATLLKSFFAHPELDETKASFYGRHRVPADFAKRVSLMFPFFRGLAEEFEPEVLLEHGDEIDLGGIPFKVLHTPGHTPGHICLEQRESGIVFTGDCVITADATHISMRPEANGSDPIGSFLESLKLLGSLGPLTALPGHGPPIQDLSSRATEIRAHLEGRLDDVENALDNTPRAAFEVCGGPPDTRIRAFARWLAVSQTLAFLEHLVRRGRADCIETDDGLLYRRARQNDNLSIGGSSRGRLNE